MNSKSLRKALPAALAVVAALALAAPAAQATPPAAPYTQFAGCPSPAESPTTVVCLRTEIKSGFFKMGSKNVPISKPMVLTGGSDGNLENFKANAEGGLTPVKQLVPGGVIGLTGLDWLVNFLSIEALQLYAVTELVGTPEVAGAFKLPIRVHLINPALGNNCYVGSPTNPIKLNLGEEKSPEFSQDPTTEILTIKNGVFSDKTFSAPGASGCVLTLFGFIPISINGLVNTQSGLPAATGNETVQNIDLQLVSSSKVYP